MTTPFNQNECPICMDDIDGLSNRVTTECGHTFHCSCLMRNTAHNGFGCPYCRTTMAEIPDDSDDDFDSNDSDSNDYDLEDDTFLTSFRMFHQQLNGQEVEEEEDEDEDEDEDEEGDEDEDEEGDEDEGVIVEGRFIEGGIRRQAVEEGGVNPVVEADSEHITQKLMERGITFEDLVKTILFHEHDNYLNRYAHHERRSTEIYGQFKAVMSRFNKEQKRRINPVVQNLNSIVPQIPHNN